jgi:tetratricopeptide (TPR) repeat protein
MAAGMTASNDGPPQSGPMSQRHLIFAALVVFPLVGPLAIALAVGGPLVLMGLFVLGPGGLLYYFMLMTWWLPALYALLALPYFLTGVLVTLAGVLLRRSSLAIALIAAELAFVIYLAASYLAFGRVIAIGAPDHANIAPMLRSPGSALVILVGAAICWFIIRRIARPPAVQGSRWERPVALGVMLAGAVGLAAMLAQGARQPEIAWKDCTEGGWNERMRGCSVIIGRGDREPVARRVTAHLRRATAYEELRRDFTRAIADYTEAIRLDTSNAAAYASRALVHARQGAHDRVIADIDRALQLDPNVFGEGAYRLFRARGLAYFRRGAFDHAIADHTREIRLSPRFADGYLHRAAAHLAKKDLDRALADFGEAIRIEPYRPDGYIGRGSIYLAQGDADRALAEFDGAIKRSPGNPWTGPAYRKRGEILEARDDVAGALAAYELALKVNPNDQLALAGRDRMRSKR